MTDLPILLIAFNRPGVTRQVFQAIRAARPRRLYVAADGPRPDRVADATLCSDVRRIVEEVDWPCNLQTLFQETNLGCGPGVSRAIDWFFEHEEVGAVLEDDCLPHPDFFTYCSWALEKYRDDRRVWHIGGNNFAADPSIFNGASVGFTSLAQVWGWATWRDRWATYEYDPATLLETTGDQWRNWRLAPDHARIKLAHLHETVRRRHTWDFQWQITMLNHGGLALIPAGNLISNLGDGDDATHTPDDERCRLPVTASGFDREEWTRSAPHPGIINEELQSYFQEKMHLLPRPVDPEPSAWKMLRRKARGLLRI